MIFILTYGRPSPHFPTPCTGPRPANKESKATAAREADVSGIVSKLKEAGKKRKSAGGDGDNSFVLTKKAKKSKKGE